MESSARGQRDRRAATGHQRIGDAIRLDPVPNGEFALQTNNLPVRCKPLGLNQLYHISVAQHPLQLEDRGIEVTVK